MDKSEFVVSGIGKDTVNNINVNFDYNELLSEKLRLYDKSCNENSNINIIDK